MLHRKLRALGYDGDYSILKSYVSPRRQRRHPDATMRYEMAPGEQAQVDRGNLACLDQSFEYPGGVPRCFLYDNAK